MSKPSIYSDIKPYITVSAVLLAALGMQNYLSFRSSAAVQNSAKTASNQAATNQTVPKVRTVLEKAAHAEVLASAPEAKETKKKGKIDRITSAVGKFIGQDEKNHAGVAWKYPEEGQKENWADLTAAYASCKNGKAQSPIALSSVKMVSAFEPLFYYKTTGGEVVNNGHTIQVNLKPGSYLEVLGRKYQLKQFHFHTPAEHKIDNLTYPMSVHLVHESDQGHIVVVAIMFRPKGLHYNMLIDRLPMPQNKGAILPVNPKSMDLDPALMLPPRHSREYFAYDGSLTTPPCTENVGWIVMKTPVYTSLKRINRIGSIIQLNARALQPLNGRHVMYAH